MIAQDRDAMPRPRGEPPGAVAATTYDPGGTPDSRYCPVSSVISNHAKSLLEMPNCTVWPLFSAPNGYTRFIWKPTAGLPSSYATDPVTTAPRTSVMSIVVTR